MTVLAYLLVPVFVVAIAASITWVRNRQPTSLQSGVDSFRREMDALSPDADPYRRRTEGEIRERTERAERPDPPRAGPARPATPRRPTDEPR